MIGVGVVKGGVLTGVVRRPRPKIRPAMIRKAVRAAMPYLYSGVLVNIHKIVIQVIKTRTIVTALGMIILWSDTI